jgi:hypothetical protein
VNTMTGKTSKKTVKSAKKTRVERVAAKAGKPRQTAPKSPSRRLTEPTLLAGGNPRIAKGEGDAPVQAYIAAMPGWKREIGLRLDALIVRTIPDVRKAVKWNSPLYGVADRGWFLGIHCFASYVKVAFFRGASLHPVPPASPRARTRAISTSMKRTRSMKLS